MRCWLVRLFETPDDRGLSALLYYSKVAQESTPRRHRRLHRSGRPQGPSMWSVPSDARDLASEQLILPAGEDESGGLVVSELQIHQEPRATCVGRRLARGDHPRQGLSPREAGGSAMRQPPKYEYRGHTYAAAWTQPTNCRASKPLFLGSQSTNRRTSKSCVCPSRGL
jgi:hypothetical protein